MGYKKEDVEPAWGTAGDYKEKIMEILGKIEDVALLRRIYDLAEYLYIHK